MVVQSSLTISCKKCGGVTNIVAGQEYYKCEYCTSLILLQEVSVDRILPTNFALNCCCPSCSQAMQTGLIEGQRVMYCTSCFGVLVRHQDFGGIIHKRQAMRVGVEPAEPRSIDPAAFDRKLNCPSCENRMDVHPYYGPGNIVVDSCVDCGFMWLDHGELTRVEQTSAVRPSQPGGWINEGQNESERSRDVGFVKEPDTSNDSPLKAIADLLFFGAR